MLPASARSHYQRVQRLQLVTLASLRGTWRRIRPTGNWSEQYTGDIGPKMVALLAAAQVAAARESDRYMAEVLAELGIVAAAREGVLAPTAFAGVAGDGRDLAGLLAQSVVQAGRRFNSARYLAETAYDEQKQAAELLRAAGVVGVLAPVERFDPVQAAQQALADAGQWLDMVAQTVIADTVRAAETAAMAARPEVSGYVRMLNPPSCSRCAVLAGKWFKWNEGFERHPRCDCTHIPVREADYTDLRVNPDRYFDSLSSAEQDRIFTVDGAEAIRHGADMAQVVNARRGMRKAQLYGHDVVTTSSGTTRAGVFGHRELMRGGATTLSPEELVTRLTRTGPELRQVKRQRVQRARLMPESIFEIANGDRAEAIRLLKLYGFIL